jgi:sulfite reductase beta subunit-like hemoprotein
MAIETRLGLLAGKVIIELGNDSTNNNGCINTCSRSTMGFIGLDNEVTRDKYFLS